VQLITGREKDKESAVKYYETSFIKNANFETENAEEREIIDRIKMLYKNSKNIELEI